LQLALVISFIAADRPGIVERLSEVVAARGGNWEEARLARLGGKFAGLALVRLPAGAAGDLESDLTALTEEGIDCRVTEAGEETAAGAGITLDVMGPDRPGIVHEVTRALAAAGISLRRMESSVRSAPMSAEPLFHARLEADTAAGIDPATLERELDRIADAMGLELDLLQEP
jgi:glycine cleavage system regulatory protein